VKEKQPQPLSRWRRTGSRLHADCSVYRILEEKWEAGDPPAKGDFYVMEVADWAVALALTDERKCVMVKQFRFGSEDFTWELPAGVVDPGESPIEGAVRELYEESGYSAEAPRILGVVHPNPALQRNRCHFVLLENARRTGAGAPGPHEAFEVREVPLPELFSWARTGMVTHAIVHAALFFLQNETAGAHRPADG